MWVDLSTDRFGRDLYPLTTSNFRSPNPNDLGTSFECWETRKENQSLLLRGCSVAADAIDLWSDLQTATNGSHMLALSFSLILIEGKVQRTLRFPDFDRWKSVKDIEILACKRDKSSIPSKTWQKYHLPFTSRPLDTYSFLFFYIFFNYLFLLECSFLLLWCHHHNFTASKG